MSDLFGWDLIYKLSEESLKKKEDVLTLFIHYALIKGGYKCIGLGDDKVLTGNEVSSETLPGNWNADSTYSIRYNNNNNLYILKGLPVDSNIVYNLLDTKVVVLKNSTTTNKSCKFDLMKYYSFNKSGPEMRVSNVAFNTDSTVCALKGDLNTLIPSHEEVLKKIQGDLLSPMRTGSTKEATTQASQDTQQDTRNGRLVPEYVPPSLRNPLQFDPFLRFDPERDPLRVGRSDLDPMAQGGGGGMIFNPFGRVPNFQDPSAGLPAPLPRGAVPPGARFDPFGPVLPNPPRPRRPHGSDDFHPPGFGDMFM